MPAKKGSKRPDLSKRNKASANAGTQSLKKEDVRLIETATEIVEKKLLTTLAQEAGLADASIWTRKQLVELIRRSVNLKEFGIAIEASVKRLQISDNPSVALGVVKTALEYSVQKAPVDDQDTTGLPPIVLIQPSEK